MGVPLADATQISQKYPSKDAFFAAKLSDVQKISSNMLITKAHNNDTADLVESQQALKLKMQEFKNKIAAPKAYKGPVYTLDGLAGEQAVLHEYARDQQGAMKALLEQQSHELGQDLALVQTALPNAIPRLSDGDKSLQIYFHDLSKLFFKLPSNKLIPAQSQLFDLTDIPRSAKICTNPKSKSRDVQHSGVETSFKFDQFKKQWSASAQASITATGGYKFFEISAGVSHEEGKAGVEHSQSIKSTKVVYKTHLLEVPALCLSINPHNLNVKHNGTWLTDLTKIEDNLSALGWLVKFGSHFAKQTHTLGISWRKTLYQSCDNEVDIADVSKALENQWKADASVSIMKKAAIDADYNQNTNEKTHAIKRSANSRLSGNASYFCKGPIIADWSEYQNKSLPNPDDWCLFPQEHDCEYVPIWELLNDFTQVHSNQLKHLQEAYYYYIEMFDSHIVNNNLQPIQELGQTLASLSSIPCSTEQFLEACEKNDTFRVLACAFSPYTTINTFCLKTDMSPLMIAANNGHIACVTVLLSHPQITITLPNHSHKTALDYAFSHNYVRVCELIFNSMRSKLKGSPTACCPPKYEDCVFNGNRKFSPMAELISQNRDLLPPVKDHETELLVAITSVCCSSPSTLRSDPKMRIKNLLTQTSTILQLECRGNRGETALLRAVFYGNVDLASMLLDAKANVLVRNSKNQSSLDIAVQARHCGMVHLLLKTNAFPLDSIPRANPNVAGDDTALISTVFRNKLDDVIKYAFAPDAQVNAFNWDGLTPLMLAAREGHYDCIAILLQHKDVVKNIEMKAVRSNSPNSYIGKTAWDLAKGDCRNLIQSKICKK